jgi:hypothetical protein
MDQMYYDVAAYFVPDRTTWKKFKAFWGENDQTYWEQQTEYETPQIEAPQGGWSEGSLADYLGIPTKVDGISVSHMPFRAYCKIFDDFYRDENLKEPAFYNDDETTLTGKNKDANYDYTSYTQLGAAPLKAAKLADLFTKSLPEPQKGPAVMLPLGESAPVIGTDVETPYPNSTVQSELEDKNIAISRVINTAGTADSIYVYNAETGTDAIGNNKTIGLAADLSNALGATVAQLRMAVSVQRYYEAIARSGSRYVEVLRSIFATESSDKTQQRAQFLGGFRVPVNMTQIPATAEGTNTKVGNTGAMSQTLIGPHKYVCDASFEEHGTLMILGVARHERTYQNGIPRMLMRKKQFDYYNRALDHIGEQPILNETIYADGSSTDKEVFGYQPAFEDMRLGWKYVTGEMRSNATTPLDAWHYADDYNQCPALSGDWIDEDTQEVDRTITIQSNVSNQLFGDFLFTVEHTRGMSMYGTPGFMDHM